MDRRVLIPVPAYAQENEAGGQNLDGLRACLRATGATISYPALSLFSGDAFLFTYDDAPVFEPLRELSPLDTMTTGARGCGANGRWLVNRPLNETVLAIKDSLDQGIPVIAPFFGDSHFYTVVAGYQGDQLLPLPPGSAEPRVATVTEWHGPVAGPHGWADNPVFLPNPEAPAGWSAAGREARAFGRAVALLGGGLLPYVANAGSQEYSAVPLAGRLAAHGLAALDLLMKDLRYSEWISNFPFIWRIDAQVGLWAHRRAALAAWLGEDGSSKSLAGSLQAAVDTARQLVSWVWRKETAGFARATEVNAHCAQAPGFVFWVKLTEHELEGLRHPTIKTPWGTAVVVDTPKRRKQAVAMVQQLRAADEQLLEAFKGLA